MDSLSLTDINNLNESHAQVNQQQTLRFIFLALLIATLAVASTITYYLYTRHPQNQTTPRPQSTSIISDPEVDQLFEENDIFVNPFEEETSDNPFDTFDIATVESEDITNPF